jgi:hypothetical protein
MRIKSAVEKQRKPKAFRLWRTAPHFFYSLVPDELRSAGQVFGVEASHFVARGISLV